MRSRAARGSAALLFAAFAVGCGEDPSARRVYYANGQLWSESPYRSGRPHGVWKTFYADGTPRSESGFVDGRRTGLERRHAADGQLLSEHHFKDGLLQGAGREWHPNGQPRTEGNFAGELREGLWREWNAEGQLLWEGSFAAGVPEGVWKTYDTRRSETLSTYVAGVLQGRETVTSAGGDLVQETHYKDGVRDGHSRTWYPGGRVFLDCHYQAGEGRGTLQYPSGKRLGAGACLDGQLHGEWVFWNEDGSVDAARSGRYEHGNKVSQ